MTTKRADYEHGYASETTTAAATLRAHRRHRGSVPAAMVQLRWMIHPDRLSDRLSKYEQRLEYSIHRCLRELRTLQHRPGDDDAAADLPPSPFLDELPEPEVKSDNEQPRQPSVAQPPSAVTPQSDHGEAKEDTAEGGRATSSSSSPPTTMAVQNNATAPKDFDDLSGPTPDPGVTTAPRPGGSRTT